MTEERKAAMPTKANDTNAKRIADAKVAVDHAIEAMTCYASAKRGSRDVAKRAAEAEFHAEQQGAEDLRRNRTESPWQFRNHPVLKDVWHRGYCEAQGTVMSDSLKPIAITPTCANVVGSTALCGRSPAQRGRKCGLCGKIGRL